MQMSGAHHNMHHKAAFTVSTSYPILVESWTADNVTGIVLGSVTGALLSLCLEGLKVYSYTNTLTYRLKTCPSRVSWGQRMLGTCIHTVNSGMAYVLMLMVMTFNIYILLGVIAGAGLGHLVVRPFFFRRLVARQRRKQSVLRLLFPKPESPAATNYATLSETNQSCRQNSCQDCSESREIVVSACQHSSKAMQTECLVCQDEEKVLVCHDPIAQSRQFQVRGPETSV